MRRKVKHILKTIEVRLGNQFNKVNDNPIIIFGNQKSGTSAIAHLLAEYSGLNKTIDIPPMWPPTGIQLIKGEKEFSSFVKENKYYFSKELIKEPLFTFIYDSVINVFPNARYIHVVRDPRDNIRSLLNGRRIPGNLEKLDLSKVKVKGITLVGDKSLWWKNEEGFNYISQQALRWNETVESYLKHQDKCILVKYEDFVNDKENVIEELAISLKIKKKKDIESILNKQFQPKGNRNISWEDFFEKKNLSKIEKICGETLIKLGYKL